jgi:holliday junction resolvase YEN1
LRGCGHNTALALTQSGLGDSLLEAAQYMSRSAFSVFLLQWRQLLCHELRSDASGKIGRKCPKLAEDVPADFPNVDLVMAYVEPLTSWSRGGRDMSFLQPKEPRLDLLTPFCHQNFSWGSLNDVQLKLSKTLWDGICLKMLCMVCVHLFLCRQHMFSWQENSAGSGSIILIQLMLFPKNPGCQVSRW